jgi:hypothetical protein
MSGAAGIAAAKNRRARQDPTKKPIIDCNTLNGSCSIQDKSKSQLQSKNIQQPIHQNIDSVSMKITGPVPIHNILQVHEQRLNRIEDATPTIRVESFQQERNETPFPEEYIKKITEFEEKIHILEEVIMNLQLTITSVQGFAMETNLALMKIKKAQDESAAAAAASAAPASAAPAPAAHAVTVVVTDTVSESKQQDIMVNAIEEILNPDEIITTDIGVITSEN